MLRSRRAFRVPKSKKLSWLAFLVKNVRRGTTYVAAGTQATEAARRIGPRSGMNNNNNNKRELTAGCCQSPQWHLPRRIRRRTARTVSKGARGATEGALPSVQSTALRVEVVRKWRCRLWVIQGAVEARNLMRARRFL